MQYLDKNDLEGIFETVRKILDSKEDRLPDYSVETRGCDDYYGALLRARLNYYPDIYDKASFLFTSINKGHYFSNGNKRLSLFTAFFFLYLNKYAVRHFSKEKYRNKLKEIFPEYKEYKNYKEFNPVNFTYYNLTLIIAESNVLRISNDELK